MYDKNKYDVEINRIYYWFSNDVKAEHIMAMEKEIKKTFHGEILACQDVNALLKDTFMKKDSVFISDSAGQCLAAQNHQIPAIFYLHNYNKKESISGIPYATDCLEFLDKKYIENVYKRFFHIPWTALETKRCILREMTEDDVDDLYEIYRDASITKYTENLYADRDEEVAYIRDYIKNVYYMCGLGMWLIVEKETGKIIGRAGLAWREGYDTAEIGFVVARGYQRKGYAYEVCSAIIELCKENEMEQLRVIYHADNMASHNLCKKLGFRIIDRTVFEKEEYVNAILDIAL